jgi:hypothetical protein
MRPATPWIATAVLLVGLGSDPGASPVKDPRAADDRVPMAEDPVARLASALPDLAHDEPLGSMPDSPGLPPADAGPTRLGALDVVGVPGARRWPVTPLESSPSRGPPGDLGLSVASFPIVPPRVDKIPLDPPYRWSTGRGPPTLRSSSTRVLRSAHLTTRAQETEP